MKIKFRHRLISLLLTSFIVSVKVFIDTSDLKTSFGYFLMVFIPLLSFCEIYIFILKQPKILIADLKKDVITIKYDTGLIEQYQGGCTVWYKLPYMKRPDQPMESFLNQIETYCKKYNGSYPNSHLKNKTS